MGIWFKEMPEDYYNQCSFFEDDVMLWQNDKVYVMDNHRDAAWCWLQQCKDGESYNFMHIDRHYDMGDFYSEDDLKFFKSNRNMNYSTYANLMQKEERAKVMRWDNYIRLAYDLRPNWFRTNIFLTHRQGDVCETRRKNNMKIYELDTLFMYSYMYQYLLNLSEFLDGVVKGSGDLKWIVNLDLDVFFYHFDERIHTQLFSDDYIVEIGNSFYEMDCPLGSPSLGRVKLAKNKKDGKYVAIKILKKAELIKLKQVDHILNEIKILTMIDHPFLVHTDGFNQDKKFLYVVLELVNGGELFTYLRGVGKFPPEQAM